MEVRFKRESLFEEVWSTPLTTLAKKYGMSDNGIRKVCKALAIPLPIAGHWAKIAAGRTIPRPTLPPTKGRTEFYSSPTPRPSSSPELDEDTQWLTERTEFEDDRANHIAVALEPQRWHRLVIQTRNRLRELVKEAEQARRAADKPQKISRFPQAAFDNGSWKWKYFVERGQTLLLHRNHLPLRVTPQTSERALAILNSLLFAAEARGITPVHDDKDGRLLLKFRDCAVQVRFSERSTDVVRDKRHDSPLDRSLGKDTIKAPTGILRIYFSARGYSESGLQESADEPLEQRLNDFFKRVYRAVVRERIAERERAERDRQFEAEQERRRRVEAIKQQEVRQQAKEQERRQSLLTEASSWRDASLIRDYIAHIERELGRQGSDIHPDLAGWLIWAEQVAEEIDPTAKRTSREDIH